MNHDDIFKIKQFIRVSNEIEVILDVTERQKKILLKLLDLWNKETKSIPVGQLATSVTNVSERSVYRHLDALIKSKWIRISTDKNDHRVKLITPTPHLLKILSIQL